MKILELFGGIGACSKALERLGIDYEIADYVEIDKYAVASFNAIHNTNFLPQDIRDWDKDMEVDLIMHGSPCQDFSIAGKQAGASEGAATRSSLMYETLRIVEQVRPKYVIWENVKNILSKKHIYNWECYCTRMNELGYCNWCQVMNAKDYGVPQNRERVFTVSIRKDISDREFLFPEKQPLTKRLEDILEQNVDARFYLTEEQVKRMKTTHYERDNYDRRVQHDLCMALSAREYKDPRCVQVGTLDIKGQDIIKRVYSPIGVSPTLTSMQGGNRQPKILSSSKVRKITPKECWRLMGFGDEDFDKAAQVCSNSQLYKQAGNSIVVNVLEAILGNLLAKKD